ncbi:MAG: imelysin family protein [Pseudoruegeria sp.]
MRHILLCLSLFLGATPTLADESKIISDAVRLHILPRMAQLAASSQALANAAAAECSPTAPSLRRAYGDAFDAWIGVSHLRFGPSETDNRAFALAFWPDSRGKTPGALRKLIADEDPIVEEGGTFSDVSIAARGFYPLEFMLYDPEFAQDSAYHCALVRAMTRDIADNSNAIALDWQAQYAAAIQTPSEGGVYRSDIEALQELFKTVSTGLDFDRDVRFGRPLGTFERPRPLRAETRRSERSQHHVWLSLMALAELTDILAQNEPALKARLTEAFAYSEGLVFELNDPAFAGVSDVQGRFRIEVVQLSLDNTRDILTLELAPALGVVEGFNALDGD